MKEKLFISIFCIISLVSCIDKKGENPGREKITDVKIFPVRVREYTIPVRASGGLTTSKEMKLSFKTGGLISTIDVHEGERVKNGQMLASLDVSEIRAQQQQARIAYEKSRRDLARVTNLYRDSVATLEQLQDAQSALDISLSRQQVADYNLLHSYIKAPADGVVQKILMEEHEMVAPGYPVLLFASTGNNWIVRVALTDKDVVRLSLGDSASVTMDAFQGLTFSATVSELGAIADPLTGTYEAELLIENCNQEFRAGFIARSEIFPGEKQKGYWVPMEAVLDANDRFASVFVLDGITPVKRNVTIGAVLDNGIMITSGIKDEDVVITDGARYLGNNPRINIVNLPNSPGK